MSSEKYYLLLLALSPLTIFVIHMITGRIYCRMKLESSPLISAVWAAAAGFVFVGVLSWQGYLVHIENPWGRSIAVVYGVVIYIFLAGAYYILFAMTEAARRIKILQDIYLKRKMSEKELDQEYGAKQLLAIRLERLVALGQLDKRSEKYFLKGKVLYWVACIVSFWSKLLKFS